MRIALFVLFLTLRFYTANASISNPMFGCDTLITASGQVLLVHLESNSTDSILKFRYCGDTAGDIVEKKATFAREIRRAPVQQKELPEGAEKILFNDDLPRGAETLDLRAEEKRVTLNAKLGALFGAGSIFLHFFAVVFSPWMYLLVLPFFIAGFIFSVRTLRQTKRKPRYQKQRILGIIGLTSSIIQLVSVVLYLLFIILLILLIF